jgi:hypothetical protein
VETIDGSDYVTKGLASVAVGQEAGGVAGYGRDFRRVVEIGFFFVFKTINDIVLGV